jgi:hypothetical protein
MHEWSLDPKDDREDLELVKQANPLSNNTIEKLRARKESPTMTPSRWARFGCGVWMQGEDAAYSALERRRRPSRTWRPLEPTCDIYIGLDIGWRWDTTAVVPLHPFDRLEEYEQEIKGKKVKLWRWQRVRYGKPKILVPPRDGTSLRRTRTSSPRSCTSRSRATGSSASSSTATPRARRSPRSSRTSTASR